MTETETTPPTPGRRLCHLAALRATRGLSQREMGRRLGISQQAYSIIELGLGYGTVDVMFTILAALRLTGHPEKVWPEFDAKILREKFNTASAKAG